MSVMNIDMEFKCLAKEHDAFPENYWKISSEKQYLEAIVSQFKITNE
jgi:hypothetical protein